MYYTKTTRVWTVDFDYVREINGNIKCRRSLLIKKEHVGKGYGITHNDIGRVLVLDEQNDESILSYILDRKMHPESWKKYGGFKCLPNIE